MTWGLLLTLLGVGMLLYDLLWVMPAVDDRREEARKLREEAGTRLATARKLVERHEAHVEKARTLALATRAWAKISRNTDMEVSDEEWLAMSKVNAEFEAQQDTGSA